MIGAAESLLRGELPSHGELASLISALASGQADDEREALRSAARRCADGVFGRRVYIRGLVEITSFCARDCLYCGLRRSFRGAMRYRLTDDEISACCASGRELGISTFVLQGGEDAAFDDARLCSLVARLKREHPSCAITLSLGERPSESYRALRAAGADRYLLRHESADSTHFARLHPPDQTLERRIAALLDLASGGWQVGAGFMVGSPFQTAASLARDVRFLAELRPQMIGIGPFIPHSGTPFAQMPPGSLEQTLDMIALTRLVAPYALMPATTALATICDRGRAMGLECGANVVMPNLSPPQVRESYSIYDGKVHSGLEAAENIEQIKREISEAGFEPDMSRGDAPKIEDPGGCAPPDPAAG